MTSGADETSTDAGVNLSVVYTVLYAIPPCFLHFLFFTSFHVGIKILFDIFFFHSFLISTEVLPMKYPFPWTDKVFLI